MKIPLKKSEENLIDYSIKLAKLYSNKYNLQLRKAKGQIFTPKEVAEFMANLLDFESKNIKILDSGAGTGILIAAICNKIINEERNNLNLKITLFENDLNIIPFLSATIKECESELTQKSHKIEYFIINHDFILHNSKYLKKSKGLNGFIENEPILYDFIISNPPYYKISKNSPQSIAMKDFIYGQPNIYSLFIILSLILLKEKGEMIFITPRSFCSGLYFKKFRKWFLNRAKISRIHLFESRKSIFAEDDILQENIIFKSIKSQKISDNFTTTISKSKDQSFNNLKSLTIPYNKLIFKNNGELFIRIPTSMTELEIIKIVDRWSFSLKDLNLEISTGPVVRFRHKNFLKYKYVQDKVDNVPLLWLHNLNNSKIKWPLNKKNKEQAIIVNEKTIKKRLVLPIKNYVLLNRFSSKEQKRRLSSVHLLKEDFCKFNYIGIENHINYIHRKNSKFPKNEVLGIVALLNSSILDLYFRSFNGNTQVNATDIRTLPFPSLDIIKEIGESINFKDLKENKKLDMLLAKKLNINPEIIIKLHKKLKY